jgi:DNA-binding PadR family transcriptional regulator
VLLFPWIAVEEISEKEVILLGLIVEEPIHAYGLEEKIRFRQMDMWTTIGFSSIYRVLSGLEQKGLIDTHLAHEGQGATRKVHEINADGKRALARGVLEHLSSMKPMKSPFSVGLSNITRAPYGDVVSQLKERISSFEAVERELMAYKDKMLEAVSSSNATRARRARLSIELIFNSAALHFDAEKQSMKKALQLLGKEDRGIFENIGEEGKEP